MRHLLLCHETAGRSSEAVEGATRLLWPGKHHMCCAMDDWCTRCSSRRQLGKSAGIDGTGRPRPCDGTDPCARALRRAEHSTPRRAAYCFCYCRARCEKAIAFTVNPTRLGRAGRLDAAAAAEKKPVNATTDYHSCRRASALHAIGARQTLVQIATAGHRND
jgi:hypothetical protein